MMGSWKFQSATASGTDVSNNPSLTCFKDNTMVFTSTTAGSIDEGVTVCSPTTAGPFTWSLTTNETVLNISTTIIPGGSSAFTLVSINETNLVVSQVVNGINLVVTFKH